MYNQNQNQNQSGQRQRPESVFSKMLRAGSKNYFFDVKPASNGNNYLTISESYKKPTGEQVSNRVLVFKDHLQDFLTSLQDAGAYLK